MAFLSTSSVWWFWLTAFTAVLVGCYHIDTQNSQQYMMTLYLKLAAIALSGTSYYFVAQLLCKRSQSMNTHKLMSSNINNAYKRDVSLKYGILRANKSLKWMKESHSKYIESQQDGAYTVLRTVDKYNLFQFNMHLQRLLTTIHQHLNNSIKNIEIPSRILRKLLILNLRDGLDEFYEDEIIKADEARITIYIDSANLFKLINKNMNKTDDIKMREYLEKCLLIHFGALPDLKRPISACIRIGRQSFKTQEKSTKWAKQRNIFHKDMDKKLGLNEIIMTEIKQNDDNNDYNGYLMEGLSSNVAVLQNDMNLLTPSINDGILGGTVRGFIIDIMDQLKENDEIHKIYKEYGIIPKQIIYGKPLFSDIMKWKGIVIMSTSRLLVPIDNLYIDIDDDMLLKLVGNNRNHSIFNIKKSNEYNCQYRKIIYTQHMTDNEDNHGKDDYLENMRVFIKHHMKSHSIYIGSVFNKY